MYVTRAIIEGQPPGAISSFSVSFPVQFEAHASSSYFGCSSRLSWVMKGKSVGSRDSFFTAQPAHKRADSN